MVRKLSLFFWICMVPFGSFASDAFGPLDSKDPLQKVVKEIDTLWGDGNIAGGTTAMSAGILKEQGSPSKWEKISEEFFNDELFYHFEPKDVLEGFKLTSEVKFFEESDVEELVKAVAISNDYDTSNPENFIEPRRQAWKALRLLGVSTEKPMDRNIRVLITKAKIYSKIVDSDRKVFSFAFINMKTKKAVLCFLFEGSM